MPRKRRKGQGDESFSEPGADAKGFDLYGSLVGYGLVNISNIHNQRAKKMEETAKKAGNNYYLASGSVMDFALRWMGNKGSKNLKAADMSQSRQGLPRRQKRLLGVRPSALVHHC